jgi:hypothetical protein
VAFVVVKVALGQVFSEQFCFPCQSSLHQIHHPHNHPGQVFQFKKKVNAMCFLYYLPKYSTVCTEDYEWSLESYVANVNKQIKYKFFPESKKKTKKLELNVDMPSNKLLYARMFPLASQIHSSKSDQKR